MSLFDLWKAHTLYSSAYESNGDEDESTSGGSDDGRERTCPFFSAIVNEEQMRAWIIVRAIDEMKLRNLKDIVAAKYKNVGVKKGKYIVIHGIESYLEAAMQSTGSTRSSLPLHLWAKTAK
ncbi:hypothetical protein Tco_1102122 [Tanacetum coccineum]